MITVFIVDDEEIAIRRLERMLLGYKDIQVVGTARSAKEAIRKISNSKPDIVFMDIEIGNFSGFEVIETIRHQGVYSKIIFVTGYAHYAIKALRERALDYLLKPVDTEELKCAIQKISLVYMDNLLDAKIEKINTLTIGEKRILKRILEGKTSKQIAESEKLSYHTVDTYRRKILKKFEKQNYIEIFNLLNSST